MCMVAGIAMMAAGAAYSAYSAGEQAKAQNKQAGFNAQVARNNADISRQEGKYAQAVSEINASNARKQASHQIGAQRAQMGASGAVVDSGSFMDVTMDTAASGEREAQALLQEGNLEAWRKENEARGYSSTATQHEMSKVSVGAAVGGSVMNSVGSFGSMVAGKYI